MAADVGAAFEAFPPEHRETLFLIRDLVLATAAADARIGRIEESLKWREPAYRPASGVGTTVRLGISRKRPGACAMFVNCRTTLIATCRDLYPDAFAFEGSRALLVQAGAPLPVNAISHCTSLAFRYHAKIGAPRPQRP